MVIRNVDVVFVAFCHLKLEVQENSLKKILWNFGEIDFGMLFHCVGAFDVAVVGSTALQAARSRVRFPIVSLEFFIDVILLAALWPWG
jgi:hypothetical protein